MVRIIAAEFDSREWALDLILSDGGKDHIDLLKFRGLGVDADALKRVQVCECGSSVLFLDIGAFYHQEPVDALNQS